MECNVIAFKSDIIGSRNWFHPPPSWLPTSKLQKQNIGTTKVHSRCRFQNLQLPTRNKKHRKRSSCRVQTERKQTRQTGSVLNPHLGNAAGITADMRDICDVLVQASWSLARRPSLPGRVGGENKHCEAATMAKFWILAFSRRPMITCREGDDFFEPQVEVSVERDCRRWGLAVSREI